MRLLQFLSDYKCSHGYWIAALFLSALQPLAITTAVAQPCSVMTDGKEATAKFMPSHKQCRKACDKLTGTGKCRDLFEKFETAIGMRDDVASKHHEALVNAYEMVMTPDPAPKKRAPIEHVMETINKIAEIKKLIAATPTTSPIIALASTLATAVKDAQDAGADATDLFNTKLVDLLKAIRAAAKYGKSHSTYVADLERLKTLIDNSKNKGKKDYKPGLLQLMPSPLNSDNTNVFTKLANAILTASGKQTAHLRKKRLAVLAAAKTLNVQAKTLKIPKKGNGNGSKGDGKITIAMAYFGDPDAVRDAYEKKIVVGKLKKKPDDYCDAIGYFKSECELISATMNICHDPMSGQIILAPECKVPHKDKVTTKVLTKEHRVKFCTATVKPICGGPRRANEKRIAKIGFKCGNSSVYPIEVMENEDAYIYCPHR